MRREDLLTSKHISQTVSSPDQSSPDYTRLRGEILSHTYFFTFPILSGCNSSIFGTRPTAFSLSSKVFDTESVSQRIQTLLASPSNNVSIVRSAGGFCRHKPRFGRSYCATTNYYKYIRSYTDNANGRTLAQKSNLNMADNQPSTCASFCNNAPYIGVEFD